MATKTIFNPLLKFGLQKIVDETTLPSVVGVSFKPGVANYDALPLSGNSTYDARITNDTHHLYIWNGTFWVDQGDIIDVDWSSISNKPTSSVSDIDLAVAHKDLTNNPHAVDAIDVGLGNVDNTSDINKPISTTTQDALDGKINNLDQLIETDDLLILNAENLLSTDDLGRHTSYISSTGVSLSTDEKKFGNKGYVFSNGTSSLKVAYNDPNISDFDLPLTLNSTKIIEMWFKVDNASVYFFACGHPNNTSDKKTFYVWYRKTTDSYFNTVFAINGSLEISSYDYVDSSLVTDNQWHHFLYAKINDVYAIYLDGQQVSYNQSSYEGTVLTPENSESFFRIGNENFTSGLNYKDGIRISNSNIYNLSPNGEKTDSFTLPTAAPAHVDINDYVAKIEADGTLSRTENTITDLTDAISEKHTQNTDTKLAEGEDSEVAAYELRDAANKKHTQNTDQYLDFGGSNEVSADEIRDLIDNPVELTQTNTYYVDGDIGNDTIATGSLNKPFKTIQACLNAIGQPISRTDAMRHITIYVSDKTSAIPGYSPQTYNGCYEENLVVPSRMITIMGHGIKIGSAGVTTGVGNILREYSASRRFGATSTELKPSLTLVGVASGKFLNTRSKDSLQIGGTFRTSVLKRSIDTVQGNGSNKIVCHITSGQHVYPITVTVNYPTEPYIRILVSGTTNYNGSYYITSKIDENTFEATRVSGTNVNISVESGEFYETSSSGSSNVEHETHYINCYQQGAYSCDDGTANGLATSVGVEDLYIENSKFFSSIEGRNTNLADVIDSEFNQTTIVGTITTLSRSVFGGTLSTSSFLNAGTNMHLMNCQFNGAIGITVRSTGQTVFMDSVTYGDFKRQGCVWSLYTPTITLLDRSDAIQNNSVVIGVTIKDALESLNDSKISSEADEDWKKITKFQYNPITGQYRVFYEE